MTEDLLTAVKLSQRDCIKNLIQAKYKEDFKVEELYAYRTTEAETFVVWQARCRLTEEQATDLLKFSGQHGLFTRPFDGKTIQARYAIVWAMLHDTTLAKLLPTILGKITGLAHLGLTRARSGLGVRVAWEEVGRFRKILGPNDQRFTEQSITIADQYHYQVAGLPAGLTHQELAAGLQQAGWKAIPQRQLRNTYQAATVTWWATTDAAPSFDTLAWGGNSVAVTQLEQDELDKQRDAVGKQRAKMQGKAKGKGKPPLEVVDNKENIKPKQDPLGDPWAGYVQHGGSSSSGMQNMKAIEAAKAIVPQPQPDARVKRLEDRLDKVEATQRASTVRLTSIEQNVAGISTSMEQKFSEVLAGLKGLHEQQAAEGKKRKQEGDQPMG